MGTEHHLSVKELPPRPDPVSCSPQPPHAPGWVRVRHSTLEAQDRKPNPPPDQGRVIAWYSGNERSALVVAGFWALTMVGIITLANGFGWMKIWPAWLTIGLTICVVYWRTLSKGCAAGVEWVSHGRKWVSIYELVDVTCHGRIRGNRLRMRDEAGRRMSIKVDDLYGDRVIWDLCFNGIIHSVISGGARTNAKLHVDLQVPCPMSELDD
jgi:hypothetical protein